MWPTLRTIRFSFSHQSALCPSCNGLNPVSPPRRQRGLWPTWRASMRTKRPWWKRRWWSWGTSWRPSKRTPPPSPLSETCSPHGKTLACSPTLFCPARLHYLSRVRCGTPYSKAPTLDFSITILRRWQTKESSLSLCIVGQLVASPFAWKCIGSNLIPWFDHVLNVQTNQIAWSELPVV